MKLHYSQTRVTNDFTKKIVSVPYEITLLSNSESLNTLISLVSVPYEITLLSNLKKGHYHLLLVSVPYEITLLSNLK